MSVRSDEREVIDRDCLAWMREAAAWSSPDDARFDELAQRIFAHQFEHCPPYARYCQGRGLDPGRVTSWREIPCVPAGAFKELALRSFPGERTCKTFRTSGTSGSSRARSAMDRASTGGMIMWIFR